MYKIRNQIEAQIQEIVFFASIFLSVVTFLSGVFYLLVPTESLVSILGNFGTAVNQGLFTFFGYTFFYFSVVALHMGYITNYHVFNFRDLKREYPVLAYSLFGHFILLVLFANLLSVLHISMDLGMTDSLRAGAGGVLGAVFAPALYITLGIYGSLVALIGFIAATTLIAGFIELNDVLVYLNNFSQSAKQFVQRSLQREATAGNFSPATFESNNDVVADRFSTISKRKEVSLKTAKKEKVTVKARVAKAEKAIKAVVRKAVTKKSKKTSVTKSKSKKK